MSEPAPVLNTDDTSDLVTMDQACIHVFPLLVAQLEIANQQLADGVDTLITGFTYLAQKFNDVDPSTLEKQIPTEMRQKLQRIHRFTEDLIHAGHRIHNTTVEEVTKDENNKLRRNINRIVLKTLDIQQLSAEIREQAGNVINELEDVRDELVNDADDSNPHLLKTFMELQMELNKMVVAFQFQDRVFQIISAVTNAMKDLSEFLQKARSQQSGGNNETLVSLTETVRHVERYYISKEQYELKGDKKDETSDDIELF
ncbi:MAG: hypothetical protein OEZ43_00765 [Gammaproteobacteria bacterium]|nr:hypothetical protein [Gammaproteobacteria bacterium]